MTVLTAFDTADPQGTGPRLFFQRVPEPKTAKNRVYLDVPVPAERQERGGIQERQDGQEREGARLESLGARVLRVSEHRGPRTVTMVDPDGDELCLH